MLQSKSNRNRVRKRAAVLQNGSAAGLRTRFLFCVGVACLFLAGCVNPERQFRLEERGEGWQLRTKEVDGKDFRASWIKGDNSSYRLVNYHDAPSGGFTIINTLYLEVDKSGAVKQGLLKRVAVADFSRQAYAEQGARWFQVIEGWCRVDGEGNGELKLRTQGGFEFEGDVRPMPGLEVRRPE